MTFRAGSLLLGLFLAGDCLSIETAASTAAPVMTQATIARANDRTRALLKARMAEQHIPALQVAIVVRGRVVMSEAYGRS